MNACREICILEDAPVDAKPDLSPEPMHVATFSDDEVLPVFEANLDLPRVPVKLVESEEMRKQ